MGTSNPILAPNSALFLIALELYANKTNVSPPYCNEDEVSQAALYLEFNLDNVLKAFRDLWLLEPRCEAHKGRMRKDGPFLGIEIAGRECSDRVVVLA